MTNITGAKRKASSAPSEEATSSRSNTSSVKRKQQQEALSEKEINEILKQWNKQCPHYDKEQKQTILNIKKFFKNETETKLHVLEGQLNNCPNIKILYYLEKATDLKLKGNDLNDKLKILDGLTNLVKLDISNTGLNFIPTSIFHCPVLEILDLSGNSITKLHSSLWKLETLKSLNISGNYIKKLPDGIQNLINLETLLVCPHPLTFITEEINELSSLKKLHLMVDTLKTIPNSFWDLKTLEDLHLWVQSDVEKNSTNKKFTINLKNLQKLKIFHFVGEKKLYDTHKIKNLGHLKALQSLCLKNTSVKFKDLPKKVRNNESIYIDIRPKPRPEKATGASGFYQRPEQPFHFMQYDGASSSSKQPPIKAEPVYPEKIISKNDIYAILGLDKNVDLGTFKKIYKENLKKNIYPQYHPDKIQQSLKKIAQEEKRSLTEEENTKIKEANESFQNIEIFYNQIIQEKAYPPTRIY